MSADFSSSNPFRRKRQSYLAPDARPSDDDTRVPDPTPQSPPPLSNITNLPLDSPKKSGKKVRVQSPPPLSPSVAGSGSTSTLRDETDTVVYQAPASFPQDENAADPFESTVSDDSESLEETPVSAAPPNPFSKTLETMARSGKETSVHSPPAATATTARQSMDVDAFKRLLMTGNSGLSASSTAPLPNPAHSVHHGLGDGGSSTDASSLSRQSLFEATQETHQHQETPRTSHEISESDDDPRGLSRTMSTRQRPPPPHSRHGKLIKVELKDDPVPKALGSPLALMTGLPSINFDASSPTISRTSTDINKPLPPAPVRTPGEGDTESIFDKEAVGKIPEPPSPARSVKTDKKTPPPPPLSRRHSQMVKPPRTETSRMALKQADEDTLSIASSDQGRPRSGSDRAPPPPPSRRPGSIRHSSHQAPLQSAPTAVQPSPPLSRAPSIRQNSGRPPSFIGMEVSTTAAKRSSVGPPPPPPPRHSRSSIDGGSRSGDPARRSIESVRRGSGASMITIPLVENSPPEIGTPSAAASGSGTDILADLTALQRDIDALRVRSERQRVS
ncbi:hypothetical protein B7463_g2907, partial [Scytalidium lignicola]